LTIFCTPGGSSSPLVSFFFFSSKSLSKSWRVCARLSLMLSSCAATRSFATRMSNQQWR